MKATCIFTLALLLASCEAFELELIPKAELSPEEEDYFNLVPVAAALPTGSGLGKYDLDYATVFSMNTFPKVTVPEAPSVEMAYATNPAGSIVLLSMFSTVGLDTIVMDSRTTAAALVMLHPWSINLSQEAKIQAMDYITKLPEFGPLVAEVEQGILSGAVDPLAAAGVIEKMVRIQGMLVKSNPKYISPLLFTVSRSSAEVDNLHSGAAYAVSLLTEPGGMVLGEGMAGGTTLTQRAWNKLVSDPPEEYGPSASAAEFLLPYGDGRYTLLANSGWSNQAWSQQGGVKARLANLASLVGDVAGIFSSQLAGLLKNSKCMGEIGIYGVNLYNSGAPGLADHFDEFSEGKKSGGQFTTDVAIFSAENTQQVVDIGATCAQGLGIPGTLETKVAANLLNFIRVAALAKGIINSASMLDDWQSKDDIIKYCFQIRDGQVASCVPPCTIDIAPEALPADSVGCFDRDNYASHTYRLPFTYHPSNYPRDTITVVYQPRGGEVAESVLRYASAEGIQNGTNIMSWRLVDRDTRIPIPTRCSPSGKYTTLVKLRIDVFVVDNCGKRSNTVILQPTYYTDGKALGVFDLQPVSD